ncbi:hypothetical protein V6N13_148426 [Hibiscus sabdariffa]
MNLTMLSEPEGIRVDTKYLSRERDIIHKATKSKPSILRWCHFGRPCIVPLSPLYSPISREPTLTIHSPSSLLGCSESSFERFGVSCLISTSAIPSGFDIRVTLYGTWASLCILPRIF